MRAWSPQQCPGSLPPSAWPLPALLGSLPPVSLCLNQPGGVYGKAFLLSAACCAFGTAWGRRQAQPQALDTISLQKLLPCQGLNCAGGLLVASPGSCRRCGVSLTLVAWLIPGSGRVTFNNQRSYLKAVTAAFVEIKTTKFTKKVSGAAGGSLGS